MRATIDESDDQMLASDAVKAIRAEELSKDDADVPAKLEPSTVTDTAPVAGALVAERGDATMTWLYETERVNVLTSKVTDTAISDCCRAPEEDVAEALRLTAVKEIHVLA